MASLRGVAVVGLFIHPVKSCGRVALDEAVIGPYGLRGDREWQVQGPDGQMVNQRRFPQLARVRPVPVMGGLRLSWPGIPDLQVQRPTQANSEGKTLFGRVAVADAGDEAAAWFEEVIGAPCRLAAIPEGHDRRVIIGEDLFRQDVSLVDAAPVHLVSAASHRFLLARAAEPFGIERFRPNIVLDGNQPWQEDRWRKLRVGDASITLVVPCPRCTIPQVDQDTGKRQKEPAVVLKRYRWCSEANILSDELRPLIAGNSLFGMYGSVEPVDVAVRVGDSVEVLEEAEPLIPPPSLREGDEVT